MTARGRNRTPPVAASGSRSTLEIQLCQAFHLEASLDQCFTRGSICTLDALYQGRRQFSEPLPEQTKGEPTAYFHAALGFALGFALGSALGFALGLPRSTPSAIQSSMIVAPFIIGRV